MGRYTRLCLNGGGIRGMLQVGAISAYSELIGEPYPYKIFTDGVHGISVGSFICAFIAFGFSMSEIIEMSYTMDMLDLLSKPRLQNILDFSVRKGLDTGENMHAYFKDVFAKKGMNLDTLTIGDALIPLNIIASDLSRSKPVIFYKKINVWDAIRASMSLPMVFTPHIIKGRVFVDGAIACTHVFNTVPESERDKTIAFLSANINTKNIEQLGAFAFMSHISGVRTNDLTASLKQKYPSSLCILNENTTNMMDVDPDKTYLFETGKKLGLAFFSECSNEEGSVC